MSGSGRMSKLLLPLALGMLLVGFQMRSSAQQAPSSCPIGGYAIPACPCATDCVIQSQILARLAGSVIGPDNLVIVSVNGGQVTLSGQVQTEGARDMATILAWSVRGVTCIRNQLTVAPFSASDLQLIGQVRDALGRSSLDAKRINVNVSNGVVQLSGYVTNEVDREAATLVAASVVGVTTVYNNITVRGPSGSPW